MVEIKLEEKIVHVSTKEMKIEPEAAAMAVKKEEEEEESTKEVHPPPPFPPVSYRRPSFRFLPTGEELISYLNYVMKNNRLLPLHPITITDKFFNTEPWELPESPAMELVSDPIKERFFFVKSEGKRANNNVMIPERSNHPIGTWYRSVGYMTRTVRDSKGNAIGESIAYNYHCHTTNPPLKRTSIATTWTMREFTSYEPPASSSSSTVFWSLAVVWDTTSDNDHGYNKDVPVKEFVYT